MIRKGQVYINTDTYHRYVISSVSKGRVSLRWKLDTYTYSKETFYTWIENDKIRLLPNFKDYAKQIGST